MAHRIITQVLVTGGRVFGRAFTEAWKQAAAAQKYAQANATNPNAAKTFSASGLTLDEACRILNVLPPRQGKTDMEKVRDRFKKLFDINDPRRGGSFYLQSKILRARERIEMEVRTARQVADLEAEVKEGWRPKIYKDR